MGDSPEPFAPQPSQESSAVLSLVFGLLSLTCFGLFTGIPAIVLGIVARRSIAESQGAKRGGSVALAGIITGSIGSFLTVFVVALALFGVIAGSSAESSYVMSIPPPVDHTPVAPSEAPAEEHTAAPSSSGPTLSKDVGPVHIVDLHASSGPLKTQLESQYNSASQHHLKLVIETTASECKACDEVSGTLRNPLMEKALAHVSLVRIDVDEFRNELVSLRMDETSLPWFYLMASPMQVVDSLSADEWDENTPESMAPVLSEFVRGTLVDRRAPRSGTSL